MFASQFDGGSFMPSQSTPAIDSGVSPAKNRDSQGVLAVTVKQISEASHSGDDKSIQIDGVDVTNVTLVGMMFDKAVRVTDVAFTLDDGTGRIDCKRWVNETFDRQEMESVNNGMYVRIVGHLKSFQSNIQLVAFSVRPVTNFDEITFHFINCIHLHVQSSGTKLQGTASSQSHSVITALSTPVQNRSNGVQSTPPSQLSGQVGVDGPKGFDQMVLNFLQLPSNSGQEKGVHTDELFRQLKIPKEKIMETIRSLEEEGLIYSTIDEFHYKSTSS